SGIFMDVTERKRAEQRLAAQHAVTHVLAEAGTLAEAIPEILRVVCQQVDWQMGVCWQVDPGAGGLRCHELWQAPSTAVPEFTRVVRQAVFPPGVGLPGRAWASGGL